MDATKLVLDQGCHDVVATMFDVQKFLDVESSSFLIWMFVFFRCDEYIN